MPVAPFPPADVVVKSGTRYQCVGLGSCVLGPSNRRSARTRILGTVDLGNEVIAAILRTVLGRWRATNEVNSNEHEMNISEPQKQPCVWFCIKASTAGES